jgi:hypothetical protein
MSAANEVAMTEAKLRATLSSLEGRLDDVRREQGWRAIDRALDAAPAPRAARRFVWPLAFGLAAATAAVLAIVVLRQPPTTPTLSSLPATELVAVAGQTTTFDRVGISLTLFGPAAATVDTVDANVRVQVARGTLLAERADDAPPLSIVAGESTTVSRDRRFAVHVSPSMVVMGSDERATQIIEHHAPVTVPVPDSDQVASPSPSPSPTPMPMPSPSPTPTLNPTPKPTSKPTPPPEPAPHPSLARSPAPEAEPTPEPTPMPELKLDAVELYRRAETSLAIRDPLTARKHLEQLLAEYPAHPLVDAARYDLALLARTYGERARALQLLEHIRTRGKDTNVRAAAARLEQQIRASR